MTMSTGIAGLVDVFGTLFSTAMSLITDNWLMLAIVGIPLVSGVIFAIINRIKN